MQQIGPGSWEIRSGEVYCGRAGKWYDRRHPRGAPSGGVVAVHFREGRWRWCWGGTPAPPPVIFPGGPHPPCLIGGERGGPPPLHAGPGPPIIPFLSSTKKPWHRRNRPGSGRGIRGEFPHRYHNRVGGVGVPPPLPLFSGGDPPPTVQMSGGGEGGCRKRSDRAGCRRPGWCLRVRDGA